MEIRSITQADIPALKAVLDTIELFPSAMLDQMIADYLVNPDTQEIWFTAIQDDLPISIGYCAPEQMTLGTYNLYAIGVRDDLQGKGIGSKMMTYLEEDLRKKNQRILIVDTSGTDDFAQTRHFYKKLNYQQEAVIRDFWNEGDDKVVFRKRL